MYADLDALEEYFKQPPVPPVPTAAPIEEDDSSISALFLNYLGSVFLVLAMIKLLIKLKVELLGETQLDRDLKSILTRIVAFLIEIRALIIGG
jgi:hypothetical protein